MYVCMYSRILQHKQSRPLHIFRNIQYHNLCVQQKDLFWTSLPSSNKKFLLASSSSRISWDMSYMSFLHKMTNNRNASFLCEKKIFFTFVPVKVWKENCGLGILDIARDPFLDPFRRVGSGKTAGGTLEYRPGLVWVMTCSWVVET